MSVPFKIAWHILGTKWYVLWQMVQVRLSCSTRCHRAAAVRQLQLHSDLEELHLESWPPASNPYRDIYRVILRITRVQVILCLRTTRYRNQDKSISWYTSILGIYYIPSMRYTLPQKYISAYTRNRFTRYFSVYVSLHRCHLESPDRDIELMVYTRDKSGIYLSFSYDRYSIGKASIYRRPKFQ